MSCVDDPSLTTNTEQRQLELPAGVPSLLTLYVYLSGSCNLACRHCWVAPSFHPDGSNGDYLSVDHLRSAIHGALPLGLRSLKLTGGEPLLHPQFREVVQLATDNTLAITIETNGTLVDERMAQFLKEKAPKASMSVSVDGADAKTHEALRGVKGCFDLALAGIRNLVAVEIHPQLICTLHRGNLDQIEQIARLAEELGCSSLKLNLVQLVGRGERFQETNRLTVREVIELDRRVEQDILPTIKIPIVSAVPVAFQSLGRLLNHRAGSCCGVNKMLGLLPGGKLALCGIGLTVPDLIYGDVETSTVREIWCHHPRLEQLRNQIPGELEGVCGECILRTTCWGHCIAQNYHFSGRLKASYWFCAEAEREGLFPVSRKR